MLPATDASFVQCAPWPSVTSAAISAYHAPGQRHPADRGHRASPVALRRARIPSPYPEASQDHARPLGLAYGMGAGLALARGRHMISRWLRFGPASSPRYRGVGDANVAGLCRSLRAQLDAGGLTSRTRVHSAVSRVWSSVSRVRPAPMVPETMSAFSGSSRRRIADGDLSLACTARDMVVSLICVGHDPFGVGKPKGRLSDWRTLATPHATAGESTRLRVDGGRLARPFHGRPDVRPSVRTAGPCAARRKTRARMPPWCQGSGQKDGVEAASTARMEMLGCRR